MTSAISISQANSLLAIINSPELKTDLAVVTGKIGNVETNIKTAGNVLEQSGALLNGGADIVLIEPEYVIAETMMQIEALCLDVNQKGELIIIADHCSPETMRDLFKMGVADVLIKPVTQEVLYDALSATLQKSRSRSNKGASSGKVYSLVKCGGGVGATSLATNMAQILSGVERKGLFGKSDNSKTQKTVAVLDFDVQFGTAAMSLNLKGKNSLVDLRRAAERMDGSMLLASLKQHESGVYVLCSPQDVVPFNAFDGDFMAKVVNLARQLFDYVIIDLPLAWCDWTPSVLNASDVIVPVLTPGVEHVYNAQRVISLIKQSGMQAKTPYIMVNRLDKGMGGKDRNEQIAKLLKFKTLPVFDDEKTYKIARERGQLLADVNKNGPAFKSLKSATDTIQAIERQDASVHPDLQIPPTSNNKETQTGRNV